MWELALAAIVILFLTGVLSFTNGTLQIHTGATTTSVVTQGIVNPNNPSAPPSQGSSPYPIQTNVYNALTGSAITSLSTEKVYVGQAVYDTSSSSSNPVQFSSSYYTGNQYTFAVGKSGYVTYYDTMTLPTLGLAGGQTYASVPNIYTMQVGTFVITAAWQNGTTFSSATTYNFTSGSQLSTQNIKITVSNTLANSGWASSYDPVNKQNQNLVLSINDTNSAQYLTITSPTTKLTRGSSSYYPTVIPDGVSQLNGVISSTSQVSSSGATTVTIGQSTVGGTYTITLTVAKGSLTHGSSETVGMSLYDYADATVFAGPNGNLGTYGPNAASLATFNIVFKA